MCGRKSSWSLATFSPRQARHWISASGSARRYRIELSGNHRHLGRRVVPPILIAARQPLRRAFGRTAVHVSALRFPSSTEEPAFRRRLVMSLPWLALGAGVGTGLRVSRPTFGSAEFDERGGSGAGATFAHVRRKWPARRHFGPRPKKKKKPAGGRVGDVVRLRLASGAQQTAKQDALPRS